MLLLDLARVLKDTPNLSKSLGCDDIIKYLALMRHLKPAISRCQSPYIQGPPDTLPDNIHDFINICVRLRDEDSKWAWISLRNLVWDEEIVGPGPGKAEMMSRGSTYIGLFLKYGTPRKIGQ